MEVEEPMLGDSEPFMAAFPLDGGEDSFSDDFGAGESGARLPVAPSNNLVRASPKWGITEFGEDMEGSAS